MESFSVENFNDLELLQNHLVEIDSTGARVQDVCGKNLDELDKTVFFVGAKDLNEAKETFKSWFPANADLISMGDNMTVNLRDEAARLRARSISPPRSLAASSTICLCWPK